MSTFHRAGYWIAEPTVLNLVDALVPSIPKAMMHTTAINATSRAYST